MSSNNLSQSNPFLASFGMNQKKGVSDLLTFDWKVGVIIWNIPKNQYKKNTGKDTLAYKLAIAAGPHLFKQEYGGEFNNEFASNIKTITSFKNVVDYFTIRYGLWKLSVCFDTETKEHYVVDWERRCNDEVKEYVLTKKDLLQYKQSQMIPQRTLASLNVLWKKELIFTDEISIAGIMIEILQFTQPKPPLVSVIKNG